MPERCYNYGHKSVTILSPMAKHPRTHRTQSAATMSASVFKATCLEVMDDVASRGAEIIVTKHGRPVVRVSPAADSIASPVGFLRGSVVSHGDIVGPDVAQRESSASDPLARRPR